MRDYYDLIGVRRDAGAEEVRRACRRLSPPELWDEDVAIDFPSAARVVDRIRASFFNAERGPSDDGAVVAEISLSRDEARLGVDVPLLLPTRRLCASCGGRGEVWLDRCTPCNGAGDVVSPREVRIIVPAGTEDGARFRVALAPEGGRVTAIEIRVAVR